MLKEKIHHLDDMLKSQQRKVRHMIEQVRTEDQFNTHTHTVNAINSGASRRTGINKEIIFKGGKHKSVIDWREWSKVQACGEKKPPLSCISDAASASVGKTTRTAPKRISHYLCGFVCFVNNAAAELPHRHP